MGATFYYDSMLLTVKLQNEGDATAKRQREVFKHGGGLFLRMGAINEENTGVDHYTVQLSGVDARELIVGIESGMSFLRM